MVRKQTWILIVVFAALLAVAFYLQKNPLPDAADATPSPTAQAHLLEGWQPSDIIQIELRSGQSGSVQVLRDEESGWMLGPESGAPIEGGKVEAIRSEIAEMLVQAALPAGYDLEAVGLADPAHTLILTKASGEQSEIRVGGATPTASGYYVQVDQQAPVVVSKYSIDSVLDQMTVENLAPTAVTAVPNLATEQQPTDAP